MTARELGTILQRMYMDGVGTNQVAMIHLFGILFDEDILRSGVSIKEILKVAEMPESYHSEIAKGRKLSRFVDVRSEIASRYA